MLHQYNRFFAFSFALVGALLFSACGHELTDEELLEKDRVELSGHLNSNKVMSYKFIKMVLRSSGMAQETNDPRLLAFQKKAIPIYSRFLKFDSAYVSQMGIVDYIELYSDYLALKDFVRDTDEDFFPTVSESFSNVYGSLRNEERIAFTPAKKILIQNVEHAGFSCFAILSGPVWRPIALYECSEIEPRHLVDCEGKVLLQFFRGFIFLQAGFYYLSEEALTENIAWVESKQDMELDFTQLTFHIPGHERQKGYLALHGMNHLLRGIDRSMMERDIDEERALKDFETFIEDAKKAGLDIEPVWVVEAYLYMKREQNEKAIVSLNKLKKSKLLSSKEKDAIQETINYLEKREPGKALNKVYDNVFMGKIVVSYMIAQLRDVDWEKLMKENDIPHTEEIFETVHNIEDVIENIDVYTNTDTIANVGKEVAKDVQEKVTKESKNLWEQAKGWWESE